MSNPRFERLSPVPGLGLEGYADEMTLPAVCELVGDSYVTFNTDYPHPDGTWPAGMSDLEKQPLSEESIRKIYWDNAAPVFGVA